MYNTNTHIDITHNTNNHTKNTTLVNTAQIYIRPIRSVGVGKTRPLSHTNIIDMIGNNKTNGNTVTNAANKTITETVQKTIDNTNIDMNTNTRTNTITTKYDADNTNADTRLARITIIRRGLLI